MPSSESRHTLAPSSSRAGSIYYDVDDDELGSSGGHKPHTRFYSAHRSSYRRIPADSHSLQDVNLNDVFMEENEEESYGIGSTEDPITSGSHPNVSYNPRTEPVPPPRGGIPSRQTSSSPPGECLFLLLFTNMMIH